MSKHHLSCCDDVAAVVVVHHALPYSGTCLTMALATPGTAMEVGVVGAVPVGVAVIIAGGQRTFQEVG